MGFSRGQYVEVASKEEGFVGSYYEAVVIAEILRKEYIVQYKTLVKDDLSGPLREVVTAAEVRPVPPEIKIPATGFQQYDTVDAFDNDGWWVGTVTGMLGPCYRVYFKTSGEEISFPIDMLRVHQDWVNGEWVVPKRTA